MRTMLKKRKMNESVRVVSEGSDLLESTRVTLARKLVRAVRTEDKLLSRRQHVKRESNFILVTLAL